MMYALKLELKNLVRYDDFKPNDTNWLIKAEREGEEIYFLNIAAYNGWAHTTCPVSAHHLSQGYYKGYLLTKNF